MRTKFDKAYYDRFYRNPRTRAASAADAARQADFICAYLVHLDVAVASVIDIGCGLGFLLAALAERLPRARTMGVEVSDYLCEKYGWRQASVVDLDVRPADLVVCHDVLSYLDDDDASRALDRLAALTRKALFFGAMTLEDQALCDPRRTDGDMCLRAAAWYRRRMGKDFLSVGGGLFLRKPHDAVIWTLDRL